jgi:hypothetical protein
VVTGWGCALYCSMTATAASRPPAISLTALRRLVRLGLLAAFVLALAADVRQIEASKECRGAFAAGFGSGFDVRHCNLTLKIGVDLQVSIPLPRQKPVTRPVSASAFPSDDPSERG